MRTVGTRIEACRHRASHQGASHRKNSQETGQGAIDVLLVIAFLAVSVAAAWHLLTRGFIIEKIPLYVAALLIPVYWCAVILAKNRLKRRRQTDDE